MKLNIRNLIITLSLTAFISPASFALSLQLKKAKAESEQKIEEITKKIETDCGCKPKIDVNWESFPTKNDFKWSSRMLEGASQGMALVCKDFKKEVCNGVKSIKLSLKKPMVKTLKDGVLELSSDGNALWGKDAVQKLIEENL